MARLVITDTRGNLRHHPLTMARCSIGRHASNDIVLDDKAVSGRHAQISETEGEFVIEDLNSTNGTRVGELKVERQALLSGDRLFIGRHVLEFLTSPLPEPEPEAEADTAPHPDAQMSSSEDSAPLSMDETPSPMPRVGRLRVESGPAAGKSLPLVKQSSSFGKAGVQVAAIRRDDDRYLLVGLEGPPPLLNGRPITDADSILSDGDQIEVSGTQMRFVLE